MMGLLLLGLVVTAVPAGASPSCLAMMAVHNRSQVSGRAHSNFVMDNASSHAELVERCATACCHDPACITWGIDAPLTHCNGCMDCVVGRPCCWIKHVAGRALPAQSTKTAGITTRKPAPLPPPPPPRPHPWPPAPAPPPSPAPAPEPAAPCEGELLHNGICLPAQWPPRLNWSKLCERTPRTPPYIAHPPAVISVDVGRQLFVDDFLIDTADNMSSGYRREWYGLTMDAEPTLTPDKPW